jgi:DNA polymerase-4
MEWIRPKHEEVDWLVLDLNSFFASCEQQLEPKLRGRPVGVVPMENVDTTSILAASYEAKRFGIYTGTNVGESKRLCPDIILLKADHRKYTHFHYKVLEIIESCTHIDRVMSIDEVACKMTGSQRNPENALALAHRIKEKIYRDVGECLGSSIGIAPNILLAKVASNMQKPNGLTLIRPCDLPDKLLPLELRDFSGIGERTEKRLNAAGLFSVRDLYNCERRQLRAIWGGVEGERLYDRLWGMNSNRAESKKSVLSHQHVLEPYLRNPTGAYNVLHALTIKAAERLRSIDYFCTKLSINVKMDYNSSVTSMRYWGQETNFMQTQDTPFLLNIMNDLWRQAPKDRPLRIGIALHGLVKSSLHQLDLFEKPKPKMLVSALDDINRKFGRHTVSFGLNPYVRDKVGKDKIAFQSVPKQGDYFV